MNKWRELIIGDIGDGALVSSKASAAMARFVMAGGSCDAALFSKTSNQENSMRLLFTPQAKIVALSFGATECETPQSHAEIGGLVFGDQSILDRLNLQ